MSDRSFRLSFINNLPQKAASVNEKVAIGFVNN